MKKIPYGIQNFVTIRTENYYYTDKTPFIERLDNEGAKCQMFLRPRRFGKTLLISTLENYYDINKKEQFETLFKGTYIYDHPTELKNSYYVLRLDFSGVSLDGSLENTQLSLAYRLENSIRNFYKYYPKETGGYNNFKEVIHLNTNAAVCFSDFVDDMKSKNIKIFLLIDEYDNFANNILTQHGQETYQDATHKGGFIRDFFTKIKEGAAVGVVDRIFMTGVAPMLLSDMTSGFNIASNISLKEDYHNMVGFTQKEFEDILDYYISENAIALDARNSIINICKEYYNNYRFCEQEVDRVYNSNLAIFYFNNYLSKQNRTLLDKNILTDYSKLRALVINDKHLNGNYSVLTELTSTGQTVSELVDIFPMQAIKDVSSFKSLLFYMGLTTIKEYLSDGEFNFMIPNKTINDVYFSYISEALSESFDFNFDNEKLKAAMRQMKLDGNALPALKIILDTFYSVASLRDFINRELSFKAYLLAYLNFAPYYNIYSEREFNKGFADIYLEPKTPIPQFKNFVFLIELKYVKAQDNTPEYIKELELEATNQLNQYAADSYFQDKTVKKIILILSVDQVAILKEN